LTPKQSLTSWAPGKSGILSNVVDDERADTGHVDGEQRRRAPEGPGAGELRDHVPAEIRDVSFPASVGGYARRAVDAYVERVNTVIAELEVSRSPQAAVRHALDRVGDQTSAILQKARETAEEITSSAHMEADETTSRAKVGAKDVLAGAREEADRITARAQVEAEEILARARGESTARRERVQQEIEMLRGQAEARIGELDADTEAIWQRRNQFVDEIQRLEAQLGELVSEAAARFPPPALNASQAESRPSGAEAHVEATDEPAPPAERLPVEGGEGGHSS
jgi:DivIVA domain-containing protein